MFLTSSSRSKRHIRSFKIKGSVSNTRYSPPFTASACSDQRYWSRVNGTKTLFYTFECHCQMTVYLLSFLLHLLIYSSGPKLHARITPQHRSIFFYNEFNVPRQTTPLLVSPEIRTYHYRKRKLAKCNFCDFAPKHGFFLFLSSYFQGRGKMAGYIANGMRAPKTFSIVNPMLF